MGAARILSPHSLLCGSLAGWVCRMEVPSWGRLISLGGAEKASPAECASRQPRRMNRVAVGMYQRRTVQGGALQGFGGHAEACEEASRTLVAILLRHLSHTRLRQKRLN